jgi:hypothetical protein
VSQRRKPPQEIGVMGHPAFVAGVTKPWSVLTGPHANNLYDRRRGSYAAPAVTSLG